MKSSACRRLSTTSLSESTIYTLLQSRCRITTTTLTSYLCAVLLLGTICSVAKGSPMSLTPTEFEFRGWPEYCQGAYLSTESGRTGMFAARLPQPLVKKWRKFAAQHGGTWHYCIGIVWLNRARTESDPKKSILKYKMAVSEISYSYRQTSTEKPFRAQMGTHLALAYRGLGEYDQASMLLEEIINRYPSHPGTYTAWSLVYRDIGENDLARDILLRGDKATEEKSAEIHYFLGIVYVDLKDLTAATRHADKAYALGYPLPGLKKKLKRLRNSTN